jgi:RNA recognition motif-containing protein
LFFSPIRDTFAPFSARSESVEFRTKYEKTRETPAADAPAKTDAAKPPVQAGEKERIMKLYVGNLPFGVTEEELQSLFGAYGTPDSVKIITDRDTGRSKGFGFVEFSNDTEAKNAMAALNGKEVQGRTLTVNEARPRPEGGGRGGFGGSRGRSDRY